MKISIAQVLVSRPLKNILAEDCWLDGLVLAVLPVIAMLECWTLPLTCRVG